MAEVYLALSGELAGLRTLVVLKRILPHLACNEQFVRMFLDEARIEARLDHPNVVRIIEVGHDGEEYFLAMELVQGKPLSTVLRRAAREKAPLLPALAAFIIAQAANGLGYAHTMIDSDGRPMQIVHRDVSPQNILVSFEGAVKIIDFGIAHAHGRGTRTSPGGLKGKIQYMSPEQASAAEVDPRSDVFALGVVLWEVLVGQRLFYRENELAMMRAVVDEPIPSPSQLVSTPPELEAIVMRALDRDPDRRFHTAQEMGLALERFAFASGSFSPQQLATYMKLLFASDFLQWKRTVSSAMDMEPAPNDDASRPADFQQAAASEDLQSSGATVGLRPASHQQPQRRDQPDGAAVTPILPTGSFTPSSVPSAHDRLWVYGGIAALAMISIAGVLVLSQPRAGRRPDTPAPMAATRRAAPESASAAAAPKVAPAEAPTLAAAATPPPAVQPTLASPPALVVQPPAAVSPGALAAASVAAAQPAVATAARAPAGAAPAAKATTPAPVPTPAIPAAPAPARIASPTPVEIAPTSGARVADGAKVAPPTKGPVVAASASGRMRRNKEKRAARAAKLTMTSPGRSRRISIRDVGRTHQPKLTRAAPARTSRLLMMDDMPLPPAHMDEATAPANKGESPSQSDHRRNPFD